LALRSQRQLAAADDVDLGVVLGDPIDAREVRLARARLGCCRQNRARNNGYRCAGQSTHAKIFHQVLPNACCDPISTGPESRPPATSPHGHSERCGFHPDRTWPRRRRLLPRLARRNARKKNWLPPVRPPAASGPASRRGDAAAEPAKWGNARTI